LKHIPYFLFLVLLICSFIIGSSACTAGGNGAAEVIEAYIRALVNKDTTQISNLSCADWEKEALMEVDSMTAVGTSLTDLSCRQVGQVDEDILVSCTGILALDYNGEAQEIDLSAHNFIARMEAGEWRMCGYR
jgi:hypothetical protein